MISGLVNSAVALVSSTVHAIHNPNRGEAVAAVGELTAGPALTSILSAMMGDAQGRKIMKHQPRVTDDVLEYAKTLPEGTLGSKYSKYMIENSFLPSGRPPVLHIQDPTLKYIVTRYRESHDFLHAVTGCTRTVEDEVALKMFEWYHTGLPIGVLAILGGMPHLSQSQMASVLTRHREWARQNRPQSLHGQRVVLNYMVVPWEEMLPLEHASVLDYTGYTIFPK